MDTALDELVASSKFDEALRRCDQHIAELSREPKAKGGGDDAILIQSLVFRAFLRTFTSAVSEGSPASPAQETQADKGQESADASRALALLESTEGMVPRRGFYRAMALLVQMHGGCTHAKQQFQRVAFKAYCAALAEGAPLNVVRDAPGEAAATLRHSVWPALARVVNLLVENEGEIVALRQRCVGAAEKIMFDTAYDALLRFATTTTASGGGGLLHQTVQLVAPEWDGLLPARFRHRRTSTSSSSAPAKISSDNVYICPKSLTLKARAKVAAGSLIFVDATTEVDGKRCFRARGDFQDYFNDLHCLTADDESGGDVSMDAIGRQLRVLGLAELREAARGGFGCFTSLRQVFAARSKGDDGAHENDEAAAIDELQDLHAQALAQFLFAGVATPLIADASSLVAGSNNNINNNSTASSAAAAARSAFSSASASLGLESACLSFPIDPPPTFSGLFFDDEANKAASDEAAAEGERSKFRYPAPTPRQRMAMFVGRTTGFLAGAAGLNNGDNDDNNDDDDNDKRDSKRELEEAEQVHELHRHSPFAVLNERAAQSVARRVMSPLLTWVPHACLPNAVCLALTNADGKDDSSGDQQSSDALQRVIAVVAVRDVAADEEISVSRVGYLTPPSLRALVCGGVMTANKKQSAHLNGGACRFCNGPFGDALEAVICSQCGVGAVPVEAPPRAARMFGTRTAHRCCGMCTSLLPLPQLRRDLLLRHLRAATAKTVQDEQDASSVEDQVRTTSRSHALRILHSVLQALPIVAATHHFRMKLAIDAISIAAAVTATEAQTAATATADRFSLRRLHMKNAEDVQRAKDACHALTDTMDKCGVPTLCPLRPAFWMTEVKILALGARIKQQQHAATTSAPSSFSVGYFRESAPADFASARDRCAWSFEVYSVLVSATEHAVSSGGSSGVEGVELLQRFLCAYPEELAACGVTNLAELAEMMRV